MARVQTRLVSNAEAVVISYFSVFQFICNAPLTALTTFAEMQNAAWEAFADLSRVSVAVCLDFPAFPVGRRLKKRAYSQSLDNEAAESVLSAS